MSVERCPVCCGRGFVEDTFYDRGLSSYSAAYYGGSETCKSCGGCGYLVIPNITTTQKVDTKELRKEFEKTFPSLLMNVRTGKNVVEALDVSCDIWNFFEPHLQQKDTKKSREDVWDTQPAPDKPVYSGWNIRGVRNF